MFVRRGIRKTRNIDDFLGSGTKLLLSSSSLGYSTRGERDTQFFYADCSSIRQLSTHWPNQRAFAPHSPQNTMASPRSEKSTRLVYVQISTHRFYSKSLRIPAHCFRAWRHSHPPSYFLSGVLLWHLWLLHPPRSRVNTCVNGCTYTCSKPKGSKPN